MEWSYSSASEVNLPWAGGAIPSMSPLGWKGLNKFSALFLCSSLWLNCPPNLLNMYVFHGRLIKSHEQGRWASQPIVVKGLKWTISKNVRTQKRTYNLPMQFLHTDIKTRPPCCFWPYSEIETFFLYFGGRSRQHSQNIGGKITVIWFKFFGFWRN